MRRRILLTIVAAVTVAVLALLVPAAVAVRRGVERGDLLRLQRDASIVAIGIPPSGPIDLARLQREVGADIRIGIYAPDGRLIEGAGPSVPDPVVARGLDGQLAEGYVDGAPVAVVPARLGPDGPDLVVRLEESEAAGRARIVEAILGLVAVAGLIVAAAAAAGLLLARRLSRPLEDLCTWTADVGPLAARPPPPPSGLDELDDLRAALVEGRARLTDLLLRERSFSSQVSHQLRTPVAALRVALEAELEAPRADPTTVLVEGLGALDRLEATIHQLLALARHDHQPGAVVDLRPAVDERVAWWRARYDHEHRSLTATGSTVPAAATRAAVDHILDVLLENALRHGVGAVTVTVGTVDDQPMVTVVDEGRWPERSTRSPTDRADQGHGIGLRLARSLADLSGGRLHRLPADTTTFRLSLPPAAPPPSRR